MADMLVKLYNLPDLEPALGEMKKQQIEIRRPQISEKRFVTDWTRRYYEDWWDGVRASFEQRPVTCHIAVQKQPVILSKDPYNLPEERLLGFACYDVSARGMFGPVGIREDCQGRGIGRALLLSSLHAMLDEGYAYAVVGWVGPIEFYEKVAGAVLIPDSEPGIFRGRLKLD